MQTKTKAKRWTRRRHRVVISLASLIIFPWARLKYHVQVKKSPELRKRQCIVLMNHQTAFDQFFVGMSFKGAVYYLASEDIFSMGWLSSVIKYLVAPIPIKKQTTDIRAILNCIKVAREGGTIAIAPEGNRTYSGRTEYMNPSIVSLARKLSMPILLYRIEGGYGAEPRWSDVVRRGKMRIYCAREIKPEEYAEMTDSELFEAISSTLYVDEACVDIKFRHKNRAEYLERAVYYCPFCGLSEFESHGDRIKCKKCSREIEYLETKELCGVGFDFPYRFVADWYDAQKAFMNSLDVTGYTANPIYRDRARISEVIPCEKKIPICEDVEVSLYGDRITVRGDGAELDFPFGETSAVTVLGKNKANIYHGGRIYQLKGSPRFNALKYVHIYHRYKNIIKGDENEQFLGL